MVSFHHRIDYCLFIHGPNCSQVNNLQRKSGADENLEVNNNSVEFIMLTNMHSSRMCTARTLTVFPGRWGEGAGVVQGGAVVSREGGRVLSSGEGVGRCCLGGIVQGGGCCPGRRGGCCVVGHSPPPPPPPPVDRVTHTCQNITLLRYVGANKNAFQQDVY